MLFHFTCSHVCFALLHGLRPLAVPCGPWWPLVIGRSPCKNDILHRKVESTCLLKLGNAYNKLGQYEKAISYYSQAFAISQGIDERVGGGKDSGNLGLA